MIVIIHGWSDSADSFKPLARWLAREGLARSIREIRLGDNITLDDDVNFTDLSTALEKAGKDADLPRRERSVDVIVHSTGALVIRDWMAGLQRANPVRRLLMLAPANFGSPLAHTGRSIIGRVFKGFNSERRFQTGTHILDGLEMASPYSRQLAARDLFGNRTVFGAGKVLCTVLVGTSGYTGISAVANKPGTDGTVYVCTANLNAAKLTVDFAANPQAPVYRLARANGSSAFARIDGYNHSSITLNEERDPGVLGDLIRAALKVTDRDFEAHCERLQMIVEAAEVTKGRSASQMNRYFQNTVLHVHDDAGRDVDDFFLELFMKRRPKSRSEWDAATARIQEEVVSKVHVYGGNAAHRSLLIDCNELQETFAKYPGVFCMALTAEPDISLTRSVGYRTFGWNDIDSIKLDHRQTRKMFAADRTLLMDVKIHREQLDRVFKLKRA